LTHPLVGLAFGAWMPLYVEGKRVACIYVMRMCVTTFFGETAAVEAGETDVDAKRVILRHGGV
jgi:hypothetical protein